MPVAYSFGLELPEISGVWAGFYRKEDNTFGTNPEASGTQSVDKRRVNYLSAVYPFNLWGHNMVISANYQNLYDFTREWEFPLVLIGDDSVSRNVDYEQEGSLSAIGMAYCVEVTPRISVGFTLNFWEDGLYENEWEQTTRSEWKQAAREDGSSAQGSNLPSYTSTLNEHYSFTGFNVNVGILWHATSKLTLGAVYKTPFKADLKHQIRLISSLDEKPQSCSESQELDMPVSYGVGLAYRFSDQFTISTDFYRTRWDKFYFTDANGNKTSPITGRLLSESDIDPTYQIRVGAEYLFINPKYIIPLRGGVFYDPAPAQGSPDDYFGFSLGSGIALGNVTLDIAYQYRFGNDVGTSILSNMDFSEDVEEHIVYSSVIIYF